MSCLFIREPELHFMHSLIRCFSMFVVMLKEGTVSVYRVKGDFSGCDIEIQQKKQKKKFIKNLLNSRVYGFDLKENAIMLVRCVEISLEQPVMTVIIFSFAIFLPSGRSKIAGGGLL